MESTYRKRRYPKYDRYGKNKKNNKEEDFVQNVIKQVAVCGVIFLVIFALKSLNAPMTNSIVSQLKSAITYTIDLNKTYKDVAAFTENLSSNNNRGNPIDIKDGETSTDIKDMPRVEDSTKPNAKETDLQVLEEQNDDYLEGKLDLDLSEKTPVEAQKSVITINQDITIPLNGVVTSKFGMRKHPLFQKDLFHTGIDIDGKKGENIVAAMDGQVEEVGYNDEYGKYVRLKHKDDIYTFYAHCSEVMVKKGEQVNMKDVIAKVGDLGIAAGTHLHFEILQKEKILDPLKYIDLPLDPNMTIDI
ncbi:MAG: M23 family metallopeptidase [Clostridia bacterium]